MIPDFNFSFHFKLNVFRPHSLHFEYFRITKFWLHVNVPISHLTMRFHVVTHSFILLMNRLRLFLCQTII
jgi:hypothetical protein